MGFVSSPSSTNEVNTAYGVSTANTQVSPASTQVSTASTQVSTANLSDDTIYAFLVSQPNMCQLVYEDLEQIHEDDIEEMDLKWQLALLSMRTRRECKGPRNRDNRIRNQDSTRRTVNVEEISSKAMLAIDGAGFDWSYMEDDEVPTNMALMAFSDSKGHHKRQNQGYTDSGNLKAHEPKRHVLTLRRLNLTEPKKEILSIKDPSWDKAKQEEAFCSSRYTQIDEERLCRQTSKFGRSRVPDKFKDKKALNVYINS
ncbi:hypothetical protein Tco_0359368 [Tanacetum coccineum]